MYLHSMFKQLQTFKITNLDKRGSPKEETKHVGHDVITDHTRNGHNEPDHTKNSLHGRCMDICIKVQNNWILIRFRELDKEPLTYQIIPSNRLWMMRWDWVTTIRRVTWVQPNCADGHKINDV